MHNTAIKPRVQILPKLATIYISYNWQQDLNRIAARMRKSGMIEENPIANAKANQKRKTF